MGDKTAIHWTEKTWNPVVGCHKVSAGCKNCYMFRDQLRYGNDPNIVRRTSDATFYAPDKWKDPALVFTCSWSDWFIEEADQYRDEMWAIVKRNPHLTMQILTKRTERINDCLPSDWGEGYPNVWLGASVENTEAANKRIPQLAFVKARVRFLSCEPLLEGIENLSFHLGLAQKLGKPIHWVIAGGESGPQARPMKPYWATDIRDVCKELGIPFFFKQHGGTKKIDGVWGGDKLDGVQYYQWPERID